MEYKKISKSYNIKKLNHKNLKQIYNLCIQNKLYYKHCPPLVSIQSIKQDMKALPPNKQYIDKYYIGFFDLTNNELVAIMDLIDKYPNDDTVFIGFFMVDIKYQNKLIGSKIINELIEYIKLLNYKNIRLGYVRGNNQSESFWVKNGFIDTGYRNNFENYEVIIMNKNI